MQGRLEVEKWLERPPRIARGTFYPRAFIAPALFSKLSSVTLYHCILNQTYSKLCTNQNIALHLKVWQLFWGDVQSFSPIWIAADDDNDTVDSETGAYIGGAGVGFSSWLVMAAENRAKFLLTAFIHGHHASVQHLHSHHALARLQLLLLENKYNCLKHQQPHFSDKSTLLDMHCCVVYSRVVSNWTWLYMMIYCSRRVHARTRAVSSMSGDALGCNLVGRPLRLAELTPWLCPP